MSMKASRCCCVRDLLSILFMNLKVEKLPLQATWVTKSVSKNLYASPKMRYALVKRLYLSRHVKPQPLHDPRSTPVPFSQLVLLTHPLTFCSLHNCILSVITSHAHLSHTLTPQHRQFVSILSLNLPELSLVLAYQVSTSLRPLTTTSPFILD